MAYIQTNLTGGASWYVSRRCLDDGKHAKSVVFDEGMVILPNHQWRPTFGGKNEMQT